MRVFILYVASLIATIHAFTITSPMAGQKLDPTEPITLSWTFNSTDPAAFDVYLKQAGGLTRMVQLATGVSTFASSYIIPATAVSSYGVNFTLIAEASIGGALLAISPNFTLSMGTASSSTFTGSVSSGLASASGVASASASATDNSASQVTGGTTSATATGSSFTTSTVSRSGSSTGTSASSAASATSSQNAQPKLGDKSQMAFTAAGLIAGLAALLA